MKKDLRSINNRRRHKERKSDTIKKEKVQVVCRTLTSQHRSRCYQGHIWVTQLTQCVATLAQGRTAVALALQSVKSYQPGVLLTACTPGQTIRSHRWPTSSQRLLSIRKGLFTPITALPANNRSRWRHPPSLYQGAVIVSPERPKPFGRERFPLI